MKIHVLGTGCAKCQKLYAAAQQAIASSGVDAELAKVESLDEIIEFGIAFAPGLVIDGEIKSQGKLPSTDQIVAWITEAASKAL